MRMPASASVNREQTGAMGGLSALVFEGNSTANDWKCPASGISLPTPSGWRNLRSGVRGLVAAFGISDRQRLSRLPDR